MNGTRLAVALLLLAMPALLLPVIRRTRRPARWAALIAVSMVGGFVILEVGLVHASLPVMFTLAGAEDLAESCRRLGGHLFHASPPFGAGAGILAIAIAGRTVASVLRSSRLYGDLRVGAELGTRTEIEGHLTVLVPMTSRVAVALPGGSPQILLSESLTVDLELEELNAVVRHEIAHLRHRHLVPLTVGNGVGWGLWFLPWMSRSSRTLRLALERWADEEAAENPVKRGHIRSAMLKLDSSESTLVVDRLRALDLPPVATGHSPALSWSMAFGAILPLAMGLGVTLIVHISRVLQTINPPV